VRLRNEWVQFDPRDWNADMDCTINTGLGAGTRERDMMVMSQVVMMQEKLLAAFGPDNPFVKPDQVYNAMAKMVEAAGLKSVGQYFTQPDPQEVQSKLEAIKSAPNPEEVKGQVQIQIEQAKAQIAQQSDQAKMQVDMQLEQIRMAASTEHEKAQMQADLAVKRAELANALTIAQQQIAFEREKMMNDTRLELTKLGLTQGEGGVPVDTNGKAIMDMMQQMTAVLQQLGQHMASASLPKQVIRDANGEIVGVQTMAVN
jgi:hypothetical protein